MVLGLSLSGAAPDSESHAVVLRVALAAMQHAECAAAVYALLALTQTFPVVLEKVSEGGCEVLDSVLAEVFQGLKRQLSHTFFDFDNTTSGGDGAAKARDRAMLLDVATQAQVAWKSDNSLTVNRDQVANGMERWVQTLEETNYQKERVMSQRLVLVSLLSSPSDTVIRMLFTAIETGIEEGSFDEDLITSAFRALIELKSLGILSVAEAANIIRHVTDDRFTPSKRHCISAYCCILAALHEPSSGFDESLLNKMVSDIVTTVNYWLSRKNKGGIVYEAMWALNRILETTGTSSLRHWADEGWAVARKVLDDEYFQSCHEWQNEYPDAQNAVDALKEADKLELLLRPMRCAR